MRGVLWLSLGLLLAAGCGGDDPAKLVAGPPDYLPNTSPENLIANLQLAWEARDAGGYLDLLYGGEQTATDGAFYAPFKFHFAENGDPGLPEFWVKSCEEPSVAGMFAGLPGENLPGIKSVSCALSPIGSWGVMGGDEIAGDHFPATAQWCLHSVGMLVTLKESIGDGSISKVWIEGRFLFQCVPVEVEGVTEWRLWKWWDETTPAGRVIPGDTAEGSLSQVKACFPPPSPAYLANDTPAHLLANLELALDGMDPAGYAALLYDGSEAATDGLHYQPFVFYFADLGLPASWPHADELACMETLLGEEPGSGYAGIAHASAALTAAGDWQAVAGGEVEGDACPAGTQWLSVSTNLMFTLKAAGYLGIGAWIIQDGALLYCLPVQAGGGTEWRLWKWRDVLVDKAAARPGRTEDVSLGQVKALYGP